MASFGMEAAEIFRLTSAKHRFGRRGAKSLEEDQQRESQVFFFKKLQQRYNDDIRVPGIGLEECDDVINTALVSKHWIAECSFER